MRLKYSLKLKACMQIYIYTYFLGFRELIITKQTKKWKCWHLQNLPSMSKKFLPLNENHFLKMCSNWPILRLSSPGQWPDRAGISRLSTPKLAPPQLFLPSCSSVVFSLLSFWVRKWMWQSLQSSSPLWCPPTSCSAHLNCQLEPADCQPASDSCPGLQGWTEGQKAWFSSWDLPLQTISWKLAPRYIGH